MSWLGIIEKAFENLDPKAEKRIKELTDEVERLALLRVSETMKKIETMRVHEGTGFAPSIPTLSKINELIEQIHVLQEEIRELKNNFKSFK